VFLALSMSLAQREKERKILLEREETPYNKNSLK